MSDCKKIYDEYASEFVALPGVTSSKNKEGSYLVTIFNSQAPGALKVELRYWQKDGKAVSLNVEGADCATWHTFENESLDFHFELAKAALMGKVSTNRSPLLRINEVCFKIGDSWECTRTDKATQFHYLKKRKKLSNK